MPEQLFSFEGRFIRLDQINRIKQERIDEAKRVEEEEKKPSAPKTPEKEAKPLSDFEVLMEKTARELNSICVEKKLDHKECKNKTDLVNLILGIVEEKVEAKK